MTIRVPYVLLFLLFLTLAVYYPTLFAPLNSLDDQIYVNRLLNEEGFSLSRHFRPQGAPEYYRPLLTLSFELDKHVGGLQAQFMHLVNVLVHALNVLLIFVLGRQFGCSVGQQSFWLPTFAALLYAVHPLNTEAVNWIAGRTDLLAGTFVFASLICLLQAIIHQRLGWGCAAALLMLGGALCKETALFLLPGGLLLLCWRSALPLPSLIHRVALSCGLLTAAVGYFALRFWGMHADRGLGKAVGLVGGMTEVAEAVAAPSLPLLDLVRVATKVIGFYVVKLIQPVPLNFAIHRVTDGYVPIGLAAVCLLGFMAWRRRPIDTLYLLSAAFAAPALMIPFVGVTWTPVAERYMYIPTGPFVLATVFGLSALTLRLGNRRVLPAICVGVLALAVVATVQRNLVWQDNLTLYQDAVSKSPDFAPARYELARALAAHGRQAEADEILLAAEEEAGQASSLNRAAVLVRKGEFEKARAFLRERIARRDSQELPALEMLITVTDQMLTKTDVPEERRGYYRDMIDALRRLQELSGNPFYWYRLGRVNLWLGERQEARRCFLEAAKLLPPGSPYFAPARKLAEDLAR